MLDLDKFSKQIEATVPVVNNKGRFRGRKFTLQLQDGWYRLNLSNQIDVIRPATKLEIHKALQNKKKALAYSTGGDAVPFNFSQFFEDNRADTIDVRFNTQPIFKLIEIRQWEDGFWYYSRLCPPRGPLRYFERRFTSAIPNDGEGNRAKPEGTVSEGVRPSLPSGTTPELKTVSLLADFRSFALAGELRKVSGELSAKLTAVRGRSLRGRLLTAIERAGGEYISHSRRGEGLEVVWNTGHGTRLRTYIDENLRVDSAGFCLRNDDTKHTLETIVHTANRFEEESYVNVTRE